MAVEMALEDASIMYVSAVFQHLLSALPLYWDTYFYSAGGVSANPRMGKLSICNVKVWLRC